MIYGIIIIVLYEMSRVLFKQCFEITSLHINNIITRGLCTFQVLFIIHVYMYMYISESIIHRIPLAKEQPYIQCSMYTRL